MNILGLKKCGVDMARGKDKYFRLRQYLSDTKEPILAMSFSDIEEILGFQLSASAYKYPAIWSNSDSHPLAVAWLNAGYRSEQLSLSRQTIVFRKAGSFLPDTPRTEHRRPQKQIPLITPDTAVGLIRDYYNETVKDPHGRYMSWRHCYNAFSQNRNVLDLKTTDFLALHLAFYLASWGMYRGSSFLLQKDYKIHIPVVNIIQERKYDALHGISAQELCRDENLMLLDEISCRIKVCYAEEQPSLEKTVNNATDTLVTKILLGTLGCVPAYDRYYIQSVKENRVSSGMYNSESVRRVAEFYCQNLEEFEKLRHDLSKSGIIYPPMKLMDMCFWQDAYAKERRLESAFEREKC